MATEVKKGVPAVLEMRGRQEVIEPFTLAKSGKLHIHSRATNFVNSYELSGASKFLEGKLGALRDQYATSLTNYRDFVDKTYGGKEEVQKIATQLNEKIFSGESKSEAISKVRELVDLKNVWLKRLRDHVAYQKAMGKQTSLARYSGTGFKHNLSNAYFNSKESVPIFYEYQGFIVATNYQNLKKNLEKTLEITEPQTKESKKRVFKSNIKSLKGEILPTLSNLVDSLSTVQARETVRNKQYSDTETGTLSATVDALLNAIVVKGDSSKKIGEKTAKTLLQETQTTIKGAIERFIAQVEEVGGASTTKASLSSLHHLNSIIATVIDSLTTDAGQAATGKDDDNNNKKKKKKRDGGSIKTFNDLQELIKDSANNNENIERVNKLLELFISKAFVVDAQLGFSYEVLLAEAVNTLEKMGVSQATATATVVGVETIQEKSTTDIKLTVDSGQLQKTLGLSLKLKDLQAFTHDADSFQTTEKTLGIEKETIRVFNYALLNSYYFQSGNSEVSNIHRKLINNISPLIFATSLIGDIFFTKNNEEKSDYLKPVLLVMGGEIYSIGAVLDNIESRLGKNLDGSIEEVASAFSFPRKPTLHPEVVEEAIQGKAQQTIYERLADASSLSQKNAKHFDTIGMGYRYTAINIAKLMNEV